MNQGQETHVFQGSQILALSGFLIRAPYIGVILAEKHESGLSFDRDISEMGVFDIL
jgi:hypothetical protein